MKPGFLIMHGWNGSPPGHWQYWLVQELRKKGELVHSLADPVCPKTSRELFEKPLELPGICLPDEAGHINMDSGYGL